MTTRKKTSTEPLAKPRRSPAFMKKAINATNPKVHAAANAILGEAGLTGVKVHSINFLVAPDTMTASGCENCDLATHDCVLTPNGYVCLPAHD